MECSYTFRNLHGSFASPSCGATWPVFQNTATSTFVCCPSPHGHVTVDCTYAAASTDGSSPAVGQHVVAFCLCSALRCAALLLCPLPLPFHRRSRSCLSRRARMSCARPNPATAAPRQISRTSSSGSSSCISNSRALHGPHCNPTSLTLPAHPSCHPP